jgi:hypothetical protein
LHPPPPTYTVTTQTGLGGQEPDKDPPTVSIINPVAGRKVSNTLQVSANASDNVAVGSAQFYLDGKVLGAPGTKPPYAVSWDTTTASSLAWCSDQTHIRRSI